MKKREGGRDRPYLNVCRSLSEPEHCLFPLPLEDQLTVIVKVCGMYGVLVVYLRLLKFLNQVLSIFILQQLDPAIDI